MSRHSEKAVVDHIENVGIDEYINQYQEWYRETHPSHRPKFYGFKSEMKNNMKMQGQWHKTRERLQAKLNARTDK